MAPGIEIKDVVIGTGAAVDANSIAVAHIRGFLSRGSQFWNSRAERGEPVSIAVSSRQNIAGLRQGLRGMLAGGVRELIVAPHLGYGKKGVPGLIPANAILRFEIELLEVRQAVLRPSKHNGRRLFVTHPGDATRGLPFWCFVALEGTTAGAAITIPSIDSGFQKASSRNVSLALDAAAIEEIMMNVEFTLITNSKDCIQPTWLWEDKSDPSCTITRDVLTDVRCITVLLANVQDGRSTTVSHFGLAESSSALREATFFRIINAALAPHLY